MTGKEFITRWRTEIVRGVLILGVVFGIGMFIMSMVGRGKAALSDFGHQFDSNFGGDRTHGQPWMYSKRLAPDHTLWLRNVNGSITVTPTDEQTLEIHAERTFKHSSADSVQIVTAESDGGLTVCAVWPGRSGNCGPDGHYNSSGQNHGSDVEVVFDVKLPRGVRLDATTITGDVNVDGATAPVDAVTVTGDVTVETANGPVTATTVTGDAHATMHALSGPGDVKVTTVTGDAQVDLPGGTDAVVDGHTVMGDISTDFPLPVTGKFGSHSLAGTLGKGGRRIHITTVTGDVDLREVGPTPEAAPVTAPVPPPHHPPASGRGSPRPRSGTP
jgi:cytoskeletal protein CcmA (bactofilin family)